ncbi:MAG: thioredoxin-disulfide reductase [Ferrimicrobium sp.]
MTTQRIRVGIIGSGPAGLTAAIYAARAQLEPVVIEGEASSTSDQPGGQLMLTTEIENYPGFVEGIMGPELMGNFRSQAERFGARFHTAKVREVSLANRPFPIWTTDSQQEEPAYLADSLIVATGARSLLLGVDNELELIGHGVSTCATCDGFFFRGSHIGVVGGGDSAIEEAIFLTKFAASVTIIHRRDHLRASKIMQTRAFSNEKIRFAWNRTVRELRQEGGSLSGVVVASTETNQTEVLPLTGLFVAIGHAPNTDIFKGQLEMDDAGYVITQSGTTATSVDGVFAAGDVQDHRYRQAITAAGSGCESALDIEHFLSMEGEIASGE